MKAVSRQAAAATRTPTPAAHLLHLDRQAGLAADDDDLGDDVALWWSVSTGGAWGVRLGTGAIGVGASQMNPLTPEDPRATTTEAPRATTTPCPASLPPARRTCWMATGTGTPQTKAMMTGAV